jgi:hypothetical protein
MFQRERVEDSRRLVRDRAWCELGVFLGHRGVGVPEERLHLEQAHAALDQPGREGVPKGVTGGATVPLDLGGVAVEPGPLDCVAEPLVPIEDRLSAPLLMEQHDTKILGWPPGCRLRPTCLENSQMAVES